MPKAKETDRQFVARMVIEFPGNFRADNSVLFCIICNVNVSGKRKSIVKKHLEAAKHIEAAERRKKKEVPVQSLITGYGASQPILNSFNMDLCETFVEANIPINKVKHPSVVRFLEKYTDHTVPSDTLLRQKYVPTLYDKCIEELRSKVGNKHIWVSIDETTDCEDRLVANFVFGLMEDVGEDSPERGKCYLLNMAEVNAANASEMAAFFNNSLLLLWPNGILYFYINKNHYSIACVKLTINIFFQTGIQYDKILLVLTDAAAYMIACMTSLQVLFPNMLHLTCLVHGLHRLAEFVRTKFANVNALISSTKSVFLKVIFFCFAFDLKSVLILFMIYI